MADMAQQNLFESGGQTTGPVECLGLTFENDEARREHFLAILREKLKDPEFRKIEGFPIGEDEDILALSDPPYYTACPNPFLEDFIRCYGKPYDPETDDYHREPFAADVSEGKNDPIYNAHSYHTKVPHKAIMRYILHYTEPGDIVFDGFCGTGMTGVAAQLCGDREAVQSLGYSVQKDGSILDENGLLFSMLGARKAILIDLSPIATFISNGYNNHVDPGSFLEQASQILSDVEEKLGWMYLTLHEPSKEQIQAAITSLNQQDEMATAKKLKPTFGKINYVIWSDVFNCPECLGEIVLWEQMVDEVNKKVRETFPCPHCNSELSKRSMNRSWETVFDKLTNQVIKQAKQVPTSINYQVGGKRFNKKIDSFDQELINRTSLTVEALDLNQVAIVRMPEGDESRRND